MERNKLHERIFFALSNLKQPQYNFADSNWKFNFNMFDDTYWTARQRGSIRIIPPKTMFVIVWFIKSADIWEFFFYTVPILGG